MSRPEGRILDGVQIDPQARIERCRSCGAQVAHRSERKGLLVRTMTKHWRYLKYVLKHKAYVFIYGWQLGIPWLALLHDNSKFRPDEWQPYAEFFYGGPHRPWSEVTGYEKYHSFESARRSSKEGVKDAFDTAWLYHQNRNKHHWQYWLEVSPSLHRCYYTDSRWGNGDRSPWLRRCAVAAVSFVRARTSCTPATSGRSAASTGLSTSASIATRTARPSEPGTERTTAATRTSSEQKPSGTWTRSDDGSLSTMAADAFAVGNPNSSSSPSTTPTAAANNTDAMLAGSAQPTAGSSAMASPRSSACSATTATRHSGTTGTVRMAALGLLRFDDGGVRCLRCSQKVEVAEADIGIRPMPDRYQREMLADWKGAGRAINGVEDALGWYRANRHKMTLHPETRAWIEAQLGYVEDVPLGTQPGFAFNAGREPINVDGITLQPGESRVFG